MRQKGFTLIEVLVALLILAISLSAVVIAINQHVRIAEKASDRLYAYIVAENVLGGMKMGIIDARSQHSGGDVVFGRRLTWQAQLLPDELPGVQHVRVFVKASDGQVALDGFIAK